MVVTKEERITSALREELKTTPLEQISVTSICKKSGCTRQTFYYYFTSIGDCLVNMFLEDRVMMNDANTFEEAALMLFEYVASNQQIIINAFSSGEQTMTVISYFFDSFKTTMNRIMEKNNPKAKLLSAEDKEYILSYYSSAWCFSFLGWIQGGCVTTPKQEVKKMFVIAKGSLVEAVDKFVKFRKAQKA